MRRIVLMMAVILTLTVPVIEISAAEAILPIKARIFRCVTNEERLKMCREENVCCHLVAAAIAEMETEILDEQAAVKVSRNENIEAHVSSYGSVISLVTE